MNSNEKNDTFQDKLRYNAMNRLLTTHLKLTQSPLAVKFFYTESELEFFRCGNEHTETKGQISFDKLNQNALSQQQTIFTRRENLLCSCDSSYNWQKNASRTAGKEYLSKTVFGIAVAPLGNSRFIADTINISCNQEQQKILLKAWQDAAGIEPWTAEDYELSPCEGTVFTHNKSIATICASYTNKEQTIIVIPADHLKHTVDELQTNNNLKRSSLNRSGDGFFRFTAGSQLIEDEN